MKSWLLLSISIIVSQICSAYSNSFSIINVIDTSKNEYLYKQFTKLNSYLNWYLYIKSQGGFPAIPNISHELKLYDSSRNVALIKKYFIISKDAVQNDTSIYFNNSFREAILNYQKRMGLRITGIVDQSLINDLNTNIDRRITSIQSSLKRFNDLQSVSNANVILINIPDFNLYVIENGQYLFSMKVIVGKTTNKTSIFYKPLSNIVLCPYWNVPKNILEKEILPMLKYNRNFLSANNMEWYKNGIRQKPGRNNALGLIKFLFPNSFNIYMHDTPLKYLFKEDTRAFSHGCIRIEDAKKLANYLLKKDTSWNSEKIDLFLSKNKETNISLKENTMVIIDYFTTWVDELGKINFRKDIYQLN